MNWESKPSVNLDDNDGSQRTRYQQDRFTENEFWDALDMIRNKLKNQPGMTEVVRADGSKIVRYEGDPATLVIPVASGATVRNRVPVALENEAGRCDNEWCGRSYRWPLRREGGRFCSAACADGKTRLTVEHTTGRILAVRQDVSR